MSSLVVKPCVFTRAGLFGSSITYYSTSLNSSWRNPCCDLWIDNGSASNYHHRVNKLIISQKFRFHSFLMAKINNNRGLWPTIPKHRFVADQEFKENWKKSETGTEWTSFRKDEAFFVIMPRNFITFFMVATGRSEFGLGFNFICRCVDVCLRLREEKVSQVSLSTKSGRFGRYFDFHNMILGWAI